MYLNLYIHIYTSSTFFLDYSHFFPSPCTLVSVNNMINHSSLSAHIHIHNLKLRTHEFSVFIFVLNLMFLFSNSLLFQKIALAIFTLALISASLLQAFLYPLLSAIYIFRTSQLIQRHFAQHYTPLHTLRLLRFIYYNHFSLF